MELTQEIAVREEWVIGPQPRMRGKICGWEVKASEPYEDDRAPLPRPEMH